MHRAEFEFARRGFVMIRKREGAKQVRGACEREWLYSGYSAASVLGVTLNVAFRHWPRFARLVLASPGAVWPMATTHRSWDRTRRGSS